MSDRGSERLPTGPTAPGDADPALAATAAGSHDGSPGVEHARVKALVRGALFGGGKAPVRIGRFTVLRHLGAGGMGEVYSAYDDELERKVAIKLLRTEGPAGGSARTRLRREAQAIARLSHPNVVPVYEVGEHRGKTFIAMEFVRGSTLRQWLEGGPRDQSEILDVFVQAGEGLAAAHAAGLIHRDFKPDNVMVGDDGRVRVLDFGVAAVGEPSDLGPEGRDRIDVPALTVTGALVGTPAYMAPEQLKSQAVGARSDQFGFCVSLWEALFGRRPFAGDTMAALTEAVFDPQRPEPPAVPAVPGPVAVALRRGLAVDPADRFADMAGLLAHLRPPPPRTRWTAVTVATAVGLLAASAGGYWVATARRAQCEDAATKLAEVWSPKRRSQAQSALAAAGSGVSLRSFAAAASALDGHTRAWTAAYEGACERSDDGEDRHLQRQLCLQWSLQDIEPLADAMVAGEGTKVGSIPAQVGAALPPQTCLDDAQLGRVASLRAQRDAPAPVGSERGTIVDFEGDGGVRFGAGWAPSTDGILGGRSTVSLDLVPSDLPSGGQALRIRGRVVMAGPQWAGVMVFTGDTPFGPANLKAMDTVGFWIRGDPGTYRVMLFTVRNGFNPGNADITVTKQWSWVELPLDSLDPERYDVTGLFIGSVLGGPFELVVDDIAFD